MQIPYQISLFIHLFIEKICVYLLAILVACEISTVLLRYIYDVGFLALHDLALYSFSVLVVFSIAYTFGRNQHVRVDVFREKHSASIKQKVDIACVLFCLMPFFVFTLYWVWPDVAYSWSILEGAQETGGLGGVFLVKSTLPLVCLFMIIQGVYVVLSGGKFLADSIDDKNVGEQA